VFDRRALLARTSLLLAGAATGACAATPRPAATTLPPLFDDIAERTFRFFWDTTNPANGLAPDRWPHVTFSSIAATGFALTAYPVGVERGWISREAAAERTLATLRFFWNAPQGEARGGVAGYKGFFYHFLDMQTGHRFRNTELSSVDTALLLGGILFAGQWFDRPAEAEIRDLAQRIYARVDWRWMQARTPLIALGWHPENGFIASDWHGFNEAMLVYILAQGAPEHAIGAEAWTAWCSTYDRCWRGEGAMRHIAFAPHFGHQLSHIWIDFRGIRDAAMREAGFDYFENSRRATFAQRAYAIANPMGWEGYSADIWGLSACDGPAGLRRDGREYRSYSARGPIGFPDGFDDGTIAPAAALGSIAFAPEIVLPCAEALHRRPRLYGRYGFLDSFNPGFRFADVRLSDGSVDAETGWVAGDYLGLDQGPILAMIANHRDDLIWSRMRDCAPIREGLRRAGFADAA
jgi:hypothetical protein